MDERDAAVSEGKQASRSSKGSTPSSPALDEDEIRALAEQFAASLPAASTRPEPWGVLTAISDKAKARPQGPHIFLYSTEHVLGRVVKDPSYQFDSVNVSAKHCTILRRRGKADETCAQLDGTEPLLNDKWLVLVKDSSSNGTFINSQRLKRDSPAVLLKDLDIISLVNAPEHENAFTFFFQEVKSNARASIANHINGTTSKRKSIYDGEPFGESVLGDSKRMKGLGIGGSDGPVLLDDVRRLQRSNEELRNQLEGHVLIIERLRAESRAAKARHDAEIKELRESLSAAFLDQIQELRVELGKKEKEIENYSSLCAQQQSKLEDCNRSLAAVHQSRKDADEVMKSQKANIFELKEQLEDERKQRRSDRDKAEAELKTAVERARLEGLEELKRQSESAALQLREHVEVINKLQETDKDNRSLIEALRCKLENTREELVTAERTVRSLELQLQDEVTALAIARKKIDEKEKELQYAVEELQKEKADKKKVLSKLSALELEMETAIRDLSLEKQRLQGARERILLRETQLRAFHSTAEEIAALQKKQQEQLQGMMKVLEDGEDDSHMLVENCEDGKLQSAIRKEGPTLVIKELCTHGTKDSEPNNDNGLDMDEHKKEDADDADSQTTACNASADSHKNIYKDVDESGDGDTQMDGPNEPMDVEIEAMLNVQKESELLMPVVTDTRCTQVLETQGKCANETPLLVDIGKDGPSALGGYTPSLELESNAFGKLGSGRCQNETQPLGDGLDEIEQAKVLKECNGNVVDARNGTGKQGGVLGEENSHLEGEQDSRFKGCQRREVLLMSPRAKTDFEKPVRLMDPCRLPTEQARKDSDGNGCHSHVLVGRPTGPLNTLDLLTTEVAGSWAFSTPGSVQCDNGGWSQSEEGDGGKQKGSNGARADFDESREIETECRKDQSQQKTNNINVRASARHDKERRDLNAMLGIVAPDFSRLHGLDRVIETAPDSEEHTEDEEDEGQESDECDSADESEPVSQSVSVSARY